MNQVALHVQQPSLPSPPRALSAIIRASSDPNASMLELGHLISADPAFAAAILQSANSAFYKRASAVSTVQQAVSTLGLRALRNVALCTAAKNCVNPKELGGFDVDFFWEDSLRRAVALEMLCEHTKLGDPMEGFTAGLLMDLGLVALIREQPELSKRWRSYATQSPDKRRDIEQELFKHPHDDISAQLASTWELPAMLSSVMAFHHNPGRAPADYQQYCELAQCSEYLAAVLSCSDKRQSLAQARKSLAGLGISTEETDSLISSFGQKVSIASDVFGFRVGLQPTLEDILSEANRGLMEMNLSYEELVGRLEQALAEKEALANELEARNTELEQLSVTDALTQLPNRRAFDGRLSYELGRTTRSGGTLSLIIGDIDHFKNVNDTYGHEHGDRVLKVVAEQMNVVVRKTDMVSRIGGEEFAILLPDTSFEGAELVAHKLLQHVASAEIPTPDGATQRVTISLGMTQIEGPYKGRVGLDQVATRIYKATDAMLYESKHNGRNRVTCAPSPIHWA